MSERKEQGMARRSQREQSIHDRKVQQLANRFARKGFNVKADLPGYEKPEPIGEKGRIPDIEATKPGTRKLVEVETRSTLESDKKQIQSFEASARTRNRTTFDVVVAEKKKQGS